MMVYATLSADVHRGGGFAVASSGVGVLPPTPSWGAMLADSVSYFTVDPAYLFFPGALLFIVVFSFNTARRRGP